VKLVDLSIEIEAPPHVVYRWLTEAPLLTEWMEARPGAIVEPTPGGLIRWTHRGGDTCSGYFVELRPHSRVVFTYGWEREPIGVPVGSTVVEITLDGRGPVTVVRLMQRGLSVAAAEGHAGGWSHFLGRLKELAAGQPATTSLGEANPPDFPPDEAGPATPEERFWWLARPLLEVRGVTRSTMMGLPCLRHDGVFFASFDRRTDRLVVKLRADRVSNVLDEGAGEPFAPAGRVFREWVALPVAHQDRWLALMAEARAFAEEQEPAASPTPRRTKS